MAAAAPTTPTKKECSSSPTASTQAILEDRRRGADALSLNELHSVVEELWRDSQSAFVSRYGGDAGNFSRWLRRDPKCFSPGRKETAAARRYVEDLRKTRQQQQQQQLTPPPQPSPLQAKLSDTQRATAERLLEESAPPVDDLSAEELRVVFCSVWPRSQTEFARRVGLDSGNFRKWVNGSPGRCTSTCLATRWVRHFLRVLRERGEAEAVEGFPAEAEPRCKPLMRSQANTANVWLTHDHMPEDEFSPQQLVHVLWYKWLFQGRHTLRDWARVYVVELIDVLDWYVAAMEGREIPAACSSITEWMRQYVADLRSGTVPIRPTAAVAPAKKEEVAAAAAEEMQRLSSSVQEQQQQQQIPSSRRALPCSKASSSKPAAPASAPRRGGGGGRGAPHLEEKKSKKASTASRFLLRSSAPSIPRAPPVHDGAPPTPPSSPSLSSSSMESPPQPPPPPGKRYGAAPFQRAASTRQSLTSSDMEHARDQQTVAATTRQIPDYAKPINLEEVLDLDNPTESEFFTSAFGGIPAPYYTTHVPQAQAKLSDDAQRTISTQMGPRMLSIDVHKDQPLGGGNFGTVYAGTWRGRKVAVKFPLEIPESGTSAFHAFLHEGTLWQYVRSPNCVNFFGYGSYQRGELFLVCELMTEGSLENFVLKKPKPSSDTLVQILGDVTKGMADNEMTFVHRDLAARNVLLTKEDGRIVGKVSDFGQALELRPDGTAIPGPNDRVCRTILPPESLQQGLWTSKTDVWSFAWLCFETFLPNELPSQSDVPPDPPSERPAQVPEKLFPIMKDCWNLDWNARPSFDVLRKRLEAAFPHLFAESSSSGDEAAMEDE